MNTYTFIAFTINNIIFTEDFYIDNIHTRRTVNALL